MVQSPLYISHQAFCQFTETSVAHAIDILLHTLTPQFTYSYSKIHDKWTTSCLGFS